MEKTVYIYGLCDPRTGELRYIGKTTNLQIRLAHHLCDAKASYRRLVCMWIRGVLASGGKPEMFVIEETSPDTWEESERFHIAYFRCIGCNLLNMTDGGEGALGCPQSPETVTKRNATKEPYKAEIYAKVADALRGRRPSDACLRASKEALTGKPSPKKGVPISEAQKRKLSESAMGRPSYFKGHAHTEETKRKLSQIRTGVPTGRKGIPFTEEHKQNLSRSYIFTNPQGDEIAVHGQEKFCKENGLSSSKIRDVIAGRAENHKGWKARKQ